VTAISATFPTTQPEIGPTNTVAITAAPIFIPLDVSAFIITSSLYPFSLFTLSNPLQFIN